MSNLEPTAPAVKPGWSSKSAILFLLPVVALAGVIALFWRTNGAGLNIAPAAPVETLVFERTVLRPGQIELHVRNTSPQPVTLCSVNINDAIWPFTIQPNSTIPRLGAATVTLNYDWIQAEAYELTLFSGNSIAFNTSIGVASETPVPGKKTFLSFTLIGLYVGVIPIFLGICWFPALKRIGPGGMVFLLALTAGMLIYLGIESTHEANELAEKIGSSFQGPGIVGIGIIGTFLLLEAVSRLQFSKQRSGSDQRMAVAWLIALGIGLHNLGEGLAIGASYSAGAATLGTFLVIGFIIQNLTEGLGIIAPILRDRPSIAKLFWLGMLGGAPAAIGGYIGGFTYSGPLSVLFLAIGAGALFQVAFEIGKMLWKDVKTDLRPVTIFSGVCAGMAMLWLTGLLVK